MGMARNRPRAEKRNRTGRLSGSFTSGGREKAFDFRRIARSGGDPKETIRKRKVPTFAEAAKKCFDLQRLSWKEAHALRWWASLRDYAFPKIGKMPVDVVSAQDVMSWPSPSLGSEAGHNAADPSADFRRNALGNRPKLPGGQSRRGSYPRHPEGSPGKAFPGRPL